MVCLSCSLKVARALPVFYCTLIGQRIVMLHSFIKKAQKTHIHELRIAKKKKE